MNDLFSRLLNTPNRSPAPLILVRGVAGSVFLLEGILKFVTPDKLGRRTIRKDWNSVPRSAGSLRRRCRDRVRPTHSVRAAYPGCRRASDHRHAGGDRHHQGADSAPQRILGHGTRGSARLRDAGVLVRLAHGRRGRVLNRWLAAEALGATRIVANASVRNRQPNVNAKAPTPGSRNSISNCLSTMGLGCRIN